MCFSLFQLCYIYIFSDIFTKYAYAKMLFTKKADEVLKNFKEIISEAGPPEFLVTGGLKNIFPL